MKFIGWIRGLTTKQKLLLIGLLWVCIVVALVLVTNNRTQDRVAISGIDTVTAPADRKEAMKKTLYNVLKANLSPDKNFTITDAVIREGTYIDNYDNLTNIHNASFIVDIESIKQSYIAYYEWSDNDQNPNLSGYPVTIQCLPKTFLKYGDFDCKPMGLSPNSTTPDIITRYLPYHVESKYTVTTATILDNSKTQLTVEAYMPGYMSTISAELLTQYSDELTDWITSKALDPSNYSFDFVY